MAEISTFTKENYLEIKMIWEDFRMAIDQENEEAQEASSTMKLTSSREMISEISSTITSNSLAREASTRVQAPSIFRISWRRCFSSSSTRNRSSWTAPKDSHQKVWSITCQTWVVLEALDSETRTDSLLTARKWTTTKQISRVTNSSSGSKTKCQTT